MRLFKDILLLLIFITTSASADVIIAGEQTKTATHNLSSSIETRQIRVSSGVALHAFRDAFLNRVEDYIHKGAVSGQPVANMNSDEWETTLATTVPDLLQELHSLDIDVQDYVSIYIYLDRLLSLHPTQFLLYQPKDWTQLLFVISTQWVKYHCDDAVWNEDFFYPNLESKLANANIFLTLEDYHLEEQNFLKRLNFRLGISAEEFQVGLKNLISMPTIPQHFLQVNPFFLDPKTRLNIIFLEVPRNREQEHPIPPPVAL